MRMKGELGSDKEGHGVVLLSLANGFLLEEKRLKNLFNDHSISESSL
jgi:hypothetical protein